MGLWVCLLLLMLLAGVVVVLLLVPATLSWFNDLSNRMVSFKTLVFIFSPQRYGTQHNTTGSYQVVVTVVRETM